jgi:hypothetical protein
MGHQPVSVHSRCIELAREPVEPAEEGNVIAAHLSKRSHSNFQELQHRLGGSVRVFWELTNEVLHSPSDRRSDFSTPNTSTLPEIRGKQRLPVKKLLIFYRQFWEAILERSCASACSYPQWRYLAELFHGADDQLLCNGNPYT